MVLDLAHALPVAGLRRAPLLHVARRVEVRESRHGAVRTCEVRAVHAYLVAGEQLQRMPRILVLQQQPAERHVVPRGVLHALQHAVLAQAHEHRGVELRVHAHGQVVGEQRQVGVFADGAEVTFHLFRAAEGVEGGGGHECVHAVAGRALGLVDHAQRLHVDDACQHRHAAVHHGHGLLQHVIALRIGEEGHLARGAEEEQAVHAGIDHAVDGALECLEVELALLGQRYDDRWDHAAKR